MLKAEVGQEGEQMPVGGRDEEDYSRRGQVREATADLALGGARAA